MKALSVTAAERTPSHSAKFVGQDQFSVIFMQREGRFPNPLQRGRQADVFQL